jgi:phage terminase large subunit-like protein
MTTAGASTAHPASASDRGKRGRGKRRTQPRHKARSACGRFWYDRKAADAAVGFFARFLRHTEGEWAGRPFILSDWQEHDIVRPLFGWKRDDGTRRYRICDVWVPRKNGKTELAAGIALLILLGDGEFGGQVYAMGVKEEQAKIAFNKAAAMVQMSPHLSAMLECLKTSVFCPELMAAFKPLAREPRGSHGMSMSGLIGDEMHEWADDRLYTFLHQSSGARRQPLEFRISTFGMKAGYGYETWQYDARVLAGEVDDPERLVVAYMADPDDDWTDPATWAKANPNYPVSPKHGYMEAECRKAQEMPRLENDFKRYHLNIWTEQDIRWLPMDKWDACGWPERTTPCPEATASSPSPRGGAVAEAARRENARWAGLAETLTGRRCWVGIDLAQTTDLTALVYLFAPEDPEAPASDPAGRYHLLPRFYVPEDRLLERVRRDRVEYDVWRDKGALTATPGNVTDYAWMKRDLMEDATRFQIVKAGVDPWNGTHFALDLQAEGLPVEFVRQGYASLNAPTKALEGHVLSLRLDHGGHPVLRWCARNAATAEDPAGNIKPDKSKSTERIDGITATIIALGVQMAEETKPPSVYESRGMLIL